MNVVRMSWRLLAVLTLLLGVASCRSSQTDGPTPAPARETEAPGPSSFILQQRTVEALWSAVKDNFVHMAGYEADWQGLRARFAAEALTTAPEDFVALVDEMVSVLPDDAVVWQSRAERIQEEREDDLRYEGIGAFISFRETPEPRILVLSVVEDSPAQAAGLRGHETILAIDGVPVRAEEGLRAVARIRGPADTPVVLTVRSPAGEIREVTVTRKRVVAAGQLQGGEFSDQDVGYLLFPSAAYEEIDQDLLANLQVMTQAGERELNGLIVDLRITTSRGGWPTDVFLALFTDGELGQVVNRAGAETITVAGQDFFGSQTLPIIILVGPDTQGAPELFAAYMQASGRATVLGLQTAGNVERQTEFPLPDGSRAFVSTVTYRTAAGQDVGLTGVVPDIIVPADWDSFAPNDDPVIQAALDLLMATAGS